MYSNHTQKETVIKENSKDEQLKEFRVNHNNTLLTTNQAVRVSNTDDSLKVGTRGPTLMEDFHFREKLTILTTKESPSV